ncbi:diamine N-acetyltransferase [Janthinobacterium sp. OK676]|uniref:GNAT family N-acetyltransferase n=1 Tax=unclassified Janthinobacterium TaxID=2610881 RepID=UPI00088FBD30|nr:MULTISPECIES: GNAT family N-acetyltransferase [unclassified Janthinobacterium]PJJ18063.1 diamine N-acetyltransferase [Janthinobacterium sp. 67]SDL54200.1 diamine N-acetyltransferase [Janthinobacterium sp. OK676]
MIASAALTLRPVCAANAEAVIGLPLHAAQRDFIASNADSLALAASHANMHPRAIHAGDELIGFAMYALPGSAGRQDTHVLYRLMIAAPWQGQGFARAALALLLDEMRARGAGRVVLYYVPANVRARQLYAHAGFVETGLDDDGEMMAERLLS